VQQDEIVQRIRRDGWCLVEDVITNADAAAIRDAIVAAEMQQRAEWEAFRTQEVASGRVAAPTGVRFVQGLINVIPRVAVSLTEDRLMLAAEALLGPHLRVSGVSGIVTEPGTARGHWHADWPFNRTIAAHVRAPYPDVVMQLSMIVMLTDFAPETGATFFVPGSHREPTNPSYDIGIDLFAPHPGESRAIGRAGSVFFYDSRLWHAVAPNVSAHARVAISARFAPWWLNLEVKRAGSPDHKRIVALGDGKDNSTPLVTKEAFAQIPPRSRDVFSHWVSH
jgi:ectoine hydroxylase-related dioxygenase (phytanoyl-CoA dioxygenase family)